LGERALVKRMHDIDVTRKDSLLGMTGMANNVLLTILAIAIFVGPPTMSQVVLAGIVAFPIVMYLLWRNWREEFGSWDAPRDEDEK
jgi:hypothetical protein